MRKISRRVTSVLASVATAAALLMAPTAHAQSSQDARNVAWNTHNQIHQMTEGLPPQMATSVRGSSAGAVESVFPGLINERTAAPRAAAPAPAPAPAPGFNPGPCPADARVCVDIDGRRTWLQQNGRLQYGPAYHAPGRPGEETPRGTFRVTRKVKDEVSYLFNNAPMPNAVYFTNRGHAFHEGNTYYESAGCVRLAPQDALKYFNELQIGDKVFIY